MQAKPAPPGLTAASLKLHELMEQGVAPPRTPEGSLEDGCFESAASHMSSCGSSLSSFGGECGPPLAPCPIGLVDEAPPSSRPVAPQDCLVSCSTVCSVTSSTSSRNIGAVPSTPAALTPRLATTRDGSPARSARSSATTVSSAATTSSRRPGCSASSTRSTSGGVPPPSRAARLQMAHKGTSQLTQTAVDRLNRLHDSQDLAALQARLCALLPAFVAGEVDAAQLLGACSDTCLKLAAMCGPRPPGATAQLAAAMCALEVCEATRLLHSGARSQAACLLEGCVNVWQQLGGPHEPRSWLAARTLGALALERRQLDAAEGWYRHALAAKEAGEGVTPTLAGHCRQLALTLWEAGAGEKLHEAAELYQQYISMLTTLKGTSALEMAGHWAFLGSLMVADGKLSAAERAYRRCLAATRACLPDEHPAVAAAANNLATVLQESDQLAEAEALYTQALRTCGAGAGAEGAPGGAQLPVLGAVLHNLGSLRGDQQLLREAGLWYREAVRVKTWGGAMHPSLELTAANLAAVGAGPPPTWEAGEGAAEAGGLLRRQLAAVPPAWTD